MATLSTKTLLIATSITGAGIAGTGAVFLATNNKEKTDKSDKQVSDSSAGKAEKQKSKLEILKHKQLQKRYLNY